MIGHKSINTPREIDNKSIATPRIEDKTIDEIVLIADVSINTEA